MKQNQQRTNPLNVVEAGGLALLIYGAYKMFFTDYSKLAARFDEYRNFTTVEGTSLIAKKWMKDTGKKIPSGTATAGNTVSPLEKVLIGTKGRKTGGDAGVLVAKSTINPLNEDEDAIYKAFRSLDCIAELPYMNLTYFGLKKENIFDALDRLFDDKEKANCCKILDTKPWYYDGPERRISKKIIE